MHQNVCKVCMFPKSRVLELVQDDVITFFVRMLEVYEHIGTTRFKRIKKSDKYKSSDKGHK